MHTSVTGILKECGLNEGEINIYLHLVGKNRLTAYRIAKDIKIHRSTCYDLLNRLEQKGFARVSEEDNKRYYSAGDLNKVLGNIKHDESLLLSLMCLYFLTE